MAGPLQLPLPSPCPPLPAPKDECPWPAAAAEAEAVAGKAGPQVWNVFFMAFKSCIIFWCQQEWREGHLRLAPKYTQDCLRFVIIFCAFLSCFSFVFPFEYCLWWASLRVLCWLLVNLFITKMFAAVETSGCWYSTKPLLLWEALPAGP